MKKILIILAFISYATLAPAQNCALSDYVNCIKNGSSNPVDYIFNLFEQSDIVVIGERDHRDTTQYELILDILRDPRFMQRVGYVYTEVGCVNRTDEVNKLIKGDFQTETAFQDALYRYMRTGEIFYPLWEKYNRVQFLKGLYEINRNSRKKITLGLTDCDFSWSEIGSAQEYKEFYYSPACEYRDSTMAANFAQMFEQQKPKKGRRKALIITNQPHAINATIAKIDYDRQGKWLKNMFGGDNVKIVLLNWADYRLFDGRRWPLVGDGMWDAAFEMVDCQSFGVDIRDTPFGVTTYKDPAYNGLQWQDVADGIIFYKPFYKTVVSMGIPGIIDAEFKDEFMRRVRIYFEAMGLAVPSFDDVRASYDGFISVPGTFPQSPEEVKSAINAIKN